ncbi:DUF4352 domain-containing protein [Serinibacter arcticus]|uniref:DUF4352 domain-containing protein n=1 Tax=Serinibacter arcticus TaxID=1655435 RepID=A0A2U1ZUU7_9MICO|nr:DUF4352 domain-containing protein [Serinibacter arcticus]PWD50739.1 DUF4352 domain-containing protein [Serinibacter arcticus]
MNQQNPFDPPQPFAQQSPTPPPASAVGHAWQGGQNGQPQQPFPPQQLPPQPPVEPKRRSWFARHKVLTGLGALVVVGIVAGVAGGGGGGGDTDAAAPAPSTSETEPAATTEAAPEATPEAEAAAPEAETVAEPPAEAAPGIGAPVRDGKFEFTVTGIEGGVPLIGSDMFGQTAQGQFVLVSVTVANIGDAAQSFFGDNATLVDDQGREHSADSTAAIYLESSESFYTEINPGNAVDAVVVFDIPADAVPTSIELHDSMFSGGVTVALG